MDLSQLAAGQTAIEATFKAVVDLVSGDDASETEVRPEPASVALEANDEDDNDYESGTDDSGEVWDTESLFEDALQEIGDEGLLGGMLRKIDISNKARGLLISHHRRRCLYARGSARIPASAARRRCQSLL